MMCFIGTVSAMPATAKAAQNHPSEAASSSSVNPTSINPSNVNDSNLLTQSIVIPPNAVGPNSLHFLPSNLIINNGTTINWVNNDIIPHQITLMPYSYQYNIPIGPTLDSGPIFSNKNFSVLFKEKGDYGYFCSIHPYLMKGMIIVNGMISVE
jgi:plastocyanin